MATIHYRKLTERRNQEIIALFHQTFSDSEGEKEGAIIAELVSNFLTTTPETDIHMYVAEEANTLTGCIFFTTFTFEKNPINTLLLSPVAVATSHQGKGIGQQLISKALLALQRDGVAMVVTYGDINFYSKVGFQQVPITTIPAPQPLSFPHGWLAQMLLTAPIPTIKGTATCVAAINKKEYW